MIITVIIIIILVIMVIICYVQAIRNPFIWVPETIGGALSTTGLVLMMIFPR